MNSLRRKLCVMSSFDPAFSDMMSAPIAMKRSHPIWLLLIVSLALVSCALFKTKASSPPASEVFPLKEEGRVLYEGEINRLVQKAGGRLFFSTAKGYLYCIDAAKKDVSWKFSARAGVSAPPCLSEGRIYFADAENELYCLDEAGTLVWEKKLAEKLSGEIGRGSGTILLSTVDGKVVALDPSTGNEMWGFNSESTIETVPVVWNQQIIFGTGDGRLYFLAPDGRRLAAFKAGARVRGPLLIDANRLYYTLQDGTFNSLNLTSRRRRWKIQTGGFLTAAPTVDEKRIYFLNSGDIFFCLNKKNGELLWWKPIPSRSFFHPEIYGAEILASSLSPLLLGFYKNNGEKSGSFDAGQEIKSNPLGFDSRLVINVYDGEAGQGILVFLKRESAVRVTSQKK